MTDLAARSRSPLAGALNFRDIGGLPARDGATTRYGTVFRSDTLQALTEEDSHKLLHEYGIRFVIDLRTAGEAVTEGRGRLGHLPVPYANVPLVDVDTPHGEPGQLVVNQYLDHLDSDLNLISAIELTAHAIRAPTVVHCAAGKDRTGVVIALLLDIAGVRREAIIADYMATAHNMAHIVERLRGWERYRRNMSVLPAEIYRCEEHTIHAFLTGLDDRYGGARNWARAKGMSDATLDLIARRLLG